MPELPLLERSISTKISELRRVAQAVGIDVKGLAPQALLAKVVEGLSTQSGVEKAVSGCSPEAQALLFDIAWHGSGVLPGRTIDGPGGHSLKGPGIRELCEDLLANGLLHSLGVRDYWATRPGYHMAAETAAWAAPVLAAEAAQAAGRPFYLQLSKAPEDRASLSCEWLSDLVRVLGELHRKPAGITQSGSIYRRDAERLRRLLTPSRLDLVSKAWGTIAAAMPDPSLYGPWAGQAQPDVGLLLWLAFGLGLLAVRDGEIEPVRDWRRRLGKKPVSEIWRRAVLAVWDLHARSLVADYWQKFISPASWLLPTRLLAAVQAGRTGLFEAVQPLEAASLLRALAQLGALEAGTVAGEPGVRLMPAGEVVYGGQPVEPALEGRWSILPNGDILVPPDLPPARLAWLEAVARPARVDVVCTYQVSQESLQHGVEAGVKPDDILGELEAWSRTGLPQAVRFRIEEWLGRVGRYRFVEAAMLVCRTREDAEAALALRAVRQDVIEVLGDTCLVIAAGREEQVRTALERGGYAALQGVFSLSGLYHEDALKERRKSQRMLRSLDWGAGTVIEAL